MRRRIQWRIAIPYVILILVTMGALALQISRSTRATYLRNMQDALASSGRLIADVASAQEEGQWAALAMHYGELLGARVTMVTANGSVVGESEQNAESMGNHLWRPEIQASLEHGEGRAIRYSETAGYDMMYVAVPIGQGPTLTGFARVALPLRALDAHVAQLRNTLLGGMGLAAALAMAIAVAIAGRITRPIRWLTETVQRMGRGELGARLVPSTEDEIAVMTTAFNEMAARYQGMMNDLAAEGTQLASVLEHMADGVLITDREGRVALINPAAARLFRTTTDEAQNRSFGQVVRHHELIEIWRQCCQQGKEAVKLVELDQRRQVLQLIATPLQVSGEECCLVLVQDLTQVRRLETVRRDFVSNVSHELRTPLASQKALVESLRTAMSDDPVIAQRFLDRMESEVDTMTQMVEELLELARIESGKVPFQMQSSTVEELVGVPTERLRPQADRAGLTLMLDLPPGLPPVAADVKRLQQVVTNIVHNAIKFTAKGGSVAVSAAQQGDEVVVAVKDSGIGIADEDLPRIFERFYKADRARATQGTGLGLSISRHIVEEHGGRIWAESREGRGSTFYFSVPLVGANKTRCRSAGHEVV